MRTLLALGLALLLSGCLSFGGGSGRSREEVERLRQTIVVDALGQIGRPYRYGGNNPDGFDCSGLVQYVFAQSGVKLPRSSREQSEIGKEIDLDDAEPGDLLFYSFTGGRIDHVAVYLGDGQAVHAPASGRQIIVAPVAQKYWMQKFVEARDVLN
ncbi:NlpC/P60 family protein [Solimonas fluminis]|uniref:NlpC/P60 family protein n=1 Tax=Solimonas fluminis TaxID=2086571 RepID=A0A2S5TDE6_9GAMM|nr:C40 family peptidase [Solimonas fluminis]PPE73000.1 NlpC/P60 family protein [Solimonas fluminis]